MCGLLNSILILFSVCVNANQCKNGQCDDGECVCNTGFVINLFNPNECLQGGIL